jgi:hypothetical protein
MIPVIPKVFSVFQVIYLFLDIPMYFLQSNLKISAIHKIMQSQEKSLESLHKKSHLEQKSPN